MNRSSLLPAVCVALLSVFLLADADDTDNQSAEVLGSPTHFVTANAPPLMIIQGVDDMNVPEAQSIQLYNELRAAGVQTQLILVQNMGHMFVQEGPEPISPSLQQMAQEMVSFFQQYVQGGG